MIRPMRGPDGNESDPIDSADPVAFAEVFAELARASSGGRADYAGLDHGRLDAEPDEQPHGWYWPVPVGGEHDADKRLAVAIEGAQLVGHGLAARLRVGALVARGHSQRERDDCGSADRDESSHG